MPILTPRLHHRATTRIPRKSAIRTRPLPNTDDRPHPVVLLVDDDASVLESLRRVFAQSGLHVVTASSGEAALEQLDRFNPNLVVTDLCMGCVSGWDLVFHHHLHDSGLPFIVITALPVREVGGVEKLAAGFFQKPLNIEALLAAIHACLAAPSATSTENTAPATP